MNKRQYKRRKQRKILKSNQRINQDIFILTMDYYLQMMIIMNYYSNADLPLKKTSQIKSA